MLLWFFLPLIAALSTYEHLLWDQCETRHSLKNTKQLENCRSIDCEEIYLHYGLASGELCEELQSNQKKRFDLSWFYFFNDQSISNLTEINGREYLNLEDHDVQVLKRALLNNENNSTNLSDWEPVTDIIGQNEVKFYQFNVNTTNTGLSSFYHILVFLSGNICSLPNSIGNNDQLTVDYGFDIEIVTNITNATYSSSSFQSGYMKGLAKHDIPSNPNDTFVTLYVRVTAPETNNLTDIWNYEFGISQNDLVYQWDNKTWITTVDTDDSSALIITGNFTNSLSLNLPSSVSTSNLTSIYEVYMYPYNADGDYFHGLKNSWCAIKNGPALLSSEANMQVSFTNRSGSLRQQFFIPNLNKSTEYVAYALKTNSNGNYGGTAFNSLKLSTKSGDACQLIYDLEFCSNVAYSVPSGGNVSDRNQLAELYDNNTSVLYQNFQKALNQIACETEPDANYSPLTSCENCAESYRNWLCSVTIPRCTTTNRSEYLYRDINGSRSQFLNEKVSPSPYFEILPCFNSCHAIVRDCPASFGFGCPSNNSQISGNSYYWDAGLDYATCNFVGTSSVRNWGGKLSISWALWFGYLFIIIISL